MPKSPVLKTRSSKASTSKKHEQAARPVSPAAKPRVHTPLAQMKHTPVEPPVPPMPSEARFTSSASMAMPKVTAPTVTTPKLSQVGKEVRIEPIRFSSLQTGGGTNMRVVGRILLFIVAVIVIGVGLILFVQNFINNQNAGNANTSSTSSVPTVPQIDGVTLATSITQDSEALLISPNEDYITSEVNVGSTENTEDDVQIATLVHTVYQTFTRITWGFSGITKGAPAIQVSPSADRTQIVLSFTNVTAAQEKLLQKISLPVGTITSMETNETADGNTTVTLTLSEASKYVVSMSADQASLNLDIKTDTQLRAATSTSSTSSETSTSSVSSSSQTSSASSSSSSIAGNVNYENDPSTSVQYIVSESAANSDLVNQIIYYQDFGPKFRFSWGFPGVGPDSIPNAKAEIVKEGNQNYLQVTIEGLARDAFQHHGIEVETFEGVNTQYANIYEARLHQRDGKTSVYRFKMRRVANYQLLATLTRDGRQLLTIDAYD